MKSAMLLIPHHIAKKAEAVFSAFAIVLYFRVTHGGLRIGPRMSRLRNDKLVLAAYRLEVVRKATQISSVHGIDSLWIPFLQRSRANQMFQIGRASCRERE